MEKEKRGAPSRGEATLFGFKRNVQPMQKKSQLPTTPTNTVLNNDTTVTRETIEPLVIQPVQLRQGTPKLGRSKRNGTGKTANRFGFRPAVSLSNKVADLQETRSESDFKETQRPQSSPAVKLSSIHSSDSHLIKNENGGDFPGKFTSHFSQLPRPQSAMRISSPNVDKWAKTAANTQTATKSQYSVPVTSRNGAAPIQIQQLDHSPSLNKTRNNQIQKPRQLEMVVSSETKAKRFELRETRASSVSPSRDLPNRISYASQAARSTSLVRERREAYQAAVNRGNNRCSLTRGFSSDDEIGDDEFDDPTEEEKQNRDKVTREKDDLQESDRQCLSPSEEMWGNGEAMAMEDELGGNLEGIDKSPESMNPPLRSVLLTIEDPTFATLAALSNSGMLEDEVSPDALDLSCSPPSMEPLPPPPNLSKDDSPGTPGTPTHASNSLSSDARDRDFLIDDEIADQPGLVFNSTSKNNQAQVNESSTLNTPKSIANLAGQVSRVLATVSSSSQQGIGKSAQDLSSAASVGTLSPCESIASDDLMVDYDRSDFEDLNDLDEIALKSELENQSGLVIKEWNSILSSHPGVT